MQGKEGSIMTVKLESYRNHSRAHRVEIGSGNERFRINAKMLLIDTRNLLNRNSNRHHQSHVLNDAKGPDSKRSWEC